MLKRLLITSMLVAILSIAFAVPVFADQPGTPGGFGLYVGATAQEEGGISEMVHEAQDLAELMGITLGGAIRMELENPWGIPPKHTP